MIQQVRTHGRFAPSPSGALHFGSIVAAVGSWVFAKKSAGLWTLRIEDVDHDRCDRATGELQIRDLAALGLHSDMPIEWQSEQELHYTDAVARLLESGHAFHCSCSRADVVAMGGVHRQCIRDLTDNASVRLRVPDNTSISFDDLICGSVKENVASTAGDFVLRRADGQFTYQLAVVVDDARQNINQVVRGADLLESTARQIYLQSLLGFATPTYAHLPLLLNKDGAKLSKRLDDPRAFDLFTDPLAVLDAAWGALSQAPIVGAKTPTEWLAHATEGLNVAKIPPSTR